MARKSNTNQVILDIIQEGVQKGILHLSTNTDKINSSIIIVKGQTLVNFSSCSYLGLEHHEAIQSGAINAITNFGTQFSASRAYISLGLYDILEDLLSKIFLNKKVVVTPTTTLGHIAAIPVLVEDGDAVIIDHQVHHSVQTATGLLRSKNVHIELVRHNNMQNLEERIVFLKSRFNQVWYLADGVYSMYGDLCPVKEIVTLLNKYPQFRFYVDDAHGMSIFGKHGAGHICKHLDDIHPQMVLATSFAKAFATGGAALVFPDTEQFKKVRTCGSTLITSGPLQPGNLGAAIACAQLHLSDEIYMLQDELHEKIKFTRSLIENAGLPLISDSDAAVFFIGVSVPKLGYRLVRRMFERGFYVNLGIFPAVPIKNTGIRFTITTLLSYKQISDMVTALKEEFEDGLRKENVTLEQIHKAFRLDVKEEKKVTETMTAAIQQSLMFKISHSTSVLDIEKEKWDKMFLGRGAFDWNALALLENIFSGNEKPEDNWEFDYLTVFDNTGNIVAATFLTTALWKDDMLSPADISLKIEELRKAEPYHLVSKITSAGSLITEGEHIFVDKGHAMWNNALTVLLDKINSIHLERKSNGVVLRDFIAPDEEVFSNIAGNGYFKTSMPDTHITTDMSWTSPEEFFNTLSRKGKMHFRTDVRRLYHEFEFKPMPNATLADIHRWYNMYLQVRERNLEINTFPLPEKFFTTIAHSTSNWEVNTLVHLPTQKEMAVVFCYRSGDTYVPTVIGMDYQYLYSHKVYKQTLFRLLERAAKTGCEKTQMGFGAPMEKRKLNCKPVPAACFVQLTDSFNTEFINNYKSIAS
jgi:7-keto-8-aminopelargonate synthetase-like enzyme/predicted N-acyltransferase